METIFVGDTITKKVHLSAEEVHPEKVFKIARPGANLNELTEDVCFFLKKLHKNATRLIMQFGYQDFRVGNSEVLRKDVLHLLEKMKQSGIEVILSGPIPYPAMTNLSFSRMYAFHTWLQEQKVSYVSNFGEFWDNSIDLFLDDGFTLSNKGILTIERNISACLQD